MTSFTRMKQPKRTTWRKSGAASRAWRSTAKRSRPCRRNGSTFPARKPLRKRLTAIIGGTAWMRKQRRRKFWTSLDPSGSRLSLAATVQDKDWDARFSRENKAWARTVPMPLAVDGANRRSRWLVDSHPGLVNLFVDQVRDLAGSGKRKSRR